MALSPPRLLKRLVVTSRAVPDPRPQTAGRILLRNGARVSGDLLQSANATFHSPIQRRGTDHYVEARRLDAAGETPALLSQALEAAIAPRGGVWSVRSMAQMTGRAAFHADAAESRFHSLRSQHLGLRCPEAAVASPRIRLDRRVTGCQSELLRSSLRSNLRRLNRR